ncbi:MAG: PQQ-dependent sugar dehydrogenase [Ilumatobacter sp.]|uniref:PQQ-dependent sugar dehydrogenase n=1 Tax=Ilumatobacter sp. TaxID=1967498 RepID=UPI0026146AB4|nr:PQQ-dependent sugar dehydrogenase [Ilumatobacter sp.]MDJ0770471.1 PQQ-dependent sugar dehydrogenase [Ilumatobacter sp.]
MRRRSFWSAVLLVATAGITAAAAPASNVAAATVPPGFTDALVDTVSRPTAVEWFPDGTIVVAEQSGRIKVGRPGEALTTAINLSVCNNANERGLMGVTPDPGYQGNGLLYVYYTRFSGNTCVNRVSQLRMSFATGTIDPASEWVMIDDISSVNSNHNGGDLDFGSDGNLYVSVGDAGRDPRGNSGSAGNNDAAQDLSLLNGKILRIGRDAFPAPGNPLSGPGTARCAFRGNTSATPSTSCQELFSWGLRNPFRIAFDRNDGSDRFFINDVGQSSFEEVNVGAIGANYGWNSREGSCPQGSSPPCAGPPAGITDPITSYGRGLGTYIAAGAFTPNGLWPAAYDGTYFFADGGTGRIWIRQPNGAVDYDNPFATGASTISDMTFGFDAAGRMVLYYVRSSGQLRMISSTAPLTTSTAKDLKMIPTTPFRAYDTQGIGVPAGRVVGGTTRVVDLDPPGAYEAALVNLTYDATDGPGFVRTWATRGARPETSSLNADRPGSIVANAAVVPLDDDGTFILESTTTGRVIVDVMAWFDDTGGSSDDGRFVALEPLRLADTRIAAGTALDSGSTNPWTRTGDRIDVEALGQLALPDDGTVQAVVFSVGAIADPNAAGFVGGFPGNGTWQNTSNVNVLPADVRANTLVVPLNGGTSIGLQAVGVDDVVVDVHGYITSDAAPTSTSGLYTPIDPVRIADSRENLGFGRLQPEIPVTVGTPLAGTTSGVVQNITVTETSAAGWVATFPGTDPPLVSNVNYTGAFQTRAALAFSRVAANGDERFTSLVGTDLVVDIVGVFSD